MNSNFEHGIQGPLKSTSPLFTSTPFHTLILTNATSSIIPETIHFRLFSSYCLLNLKCFPPVLKSNHSFSSRVKTSLILCFRINMLLLSALVYFGWASILHLFSFVLHCNLLVCLYVHLHWMRANYIKIYIMFIYYFIFSYSSCQRLTEFSAYGSYSIILF